MGDNHGIPSSSGDLAFPIAMPLRDWLFADASVDNVVSLASVDLDDRAVSVGTSIREAGWSVTRSLLDPERDSGRWPPSEDVQSKAVTISLTADQWAFVVSALRRGHGTETNVGKDEDATRSEVLREVITAVVEAGD